MLLYFGYFFWALANWKGFAEHERLA